MLFVEIVQIWVSQLESELDHRGDVEEQLKQRISSLEKQLTEKGEESSGADEAVADSPVSSKMKGSNSPIHLSPARQNYEVSSVSLEEELRRAQQMEEVGIFIFNLLFFFSFFFLH